MNYSCQPQRPRIFVVRVPRGREGTLETARLIGELIAEGAKDFRVRQKAIQIFRQCGVEQKDKWGEIQALFEWVRNNIRYTRDIFQVETLHTARRLLELRAGDCDDMTILLGSLLKSTGHPVRLCLAGFRRRFPHLYSHIYPEVLIGKKWVAIDATMHHPIGWAPPAIWLRVCDITKDGLRCWCATE
jgi:hypothetical protein